MKSTLQVYKESKYPNDTLEFLARLESSSERLGDLLESYRYLQPDGKLFTAASISKICLLHELHYLVVKHTEEPDFHERMIDRYSHEIDCIENGQEIKHQSYAEKFIRVDF